jgi:FO synthase
MQPETRDPHTAGIRRAIARAASGKTLDEAEAAWLLAARGDELAALCEVAKRLRAVGLERAGRPDVVTYSRKVFVPLTRLCRDRCHYCTFATTPGRVPAPFLSPDEVLDIARRGVELGCKEALFTLGDRPEGRWSAAREWLESRGYSDTLSYVRAMAILVLEETGLLPHLNSGVMTWEEIQRLKPVAPSMGMMLETTATKLWSEPGGCHYRSPDKQPAVRIRAIEDASRSAVPFTTGILVGIGETLEDRAESLFEIRRISKQFGAIQEVIIQNFLAKPDTAMRDAPDAGFEEYLAAIAVARVVLGPDARIQAPPNLSRLDQLSRLLDAGIDDWGGISPLTPDHVNPERPWPHLDEVARITSESGFNLRERLTVHPSVVLAGEPWIDPRVLPHVRALADPATGLADPEAVPTGRPWQELDADATSTGRTDLHHAIDVEGRRTERRSDYDQAYGSWESLREQNAARQRADKVPVARLETDMRSALRSAERAPQSLSDNDALTLARADGDALDLLCRLADAVRADTVGDVVTYAVNRNINFTNICYTGCRFCAFAQRRTDADAYSLSIDDVVSRAQEAWDLGATEICMQGGIDPQLPANFYFDLLQAVKQQLPDLHIHAFSPMEVMNGAARTGLSVHDWLVRAKECGLDSIPGTAAEILDDDVRWVLTKGKLPTRDWIRVVSTAHNVGLRSSSTMMYGHVDEPHHWVQHLRVLKEIQAETGGFTEFVPLPFVHQNAPLYLAGLSRPGPSSRDNRAVHALARLMLHGSIDHIQCSWVKLGPDGCREMLASGVNDLGGTLMEETISRMAGSGFGSFKTVEELTAIARSAGRPARQRTTTYGYVTPERSRAALEFDRSMKRALTLTEV